MTEEKKTHPKPERTADLLQDRFIKHGDLRGKPQHVTVTAVDIETLTDVETGEDVDRGIVSLKGTKKQWVLNKTNIKCLEAMFGPVLADWVGKRVTLYPTRDRGKDCIRVKGSPDIDSPVKATVPGARGKTKQVTMEKTG